MFWEGEVKQENSQETHADRSEPQNPKLWGWNGYLLPRYATLYNQQ